MAQEQENVVEIGQKILSGQEKQPSVVSKFVISAYMFIWRGEKFGESSNNFLSRLNNRRDRGFLYRLYIAVLEEKEVVLLATLDDWLGERRLGIDEQPFVRQKGGGGKLPLEKRETTQRRAPVSMGH